METPIQTDTTTEKSIKNLNRWLAILVSFVVFYSAAMLAIIDRKSDIAMQIQTQPVLMIDPMTMGINSTVYSNLVHPSFLRSTNVLSNVVTSVKPPTDQNASAALSTTAPKPMFEQKDSYEVGDFVVVNFFYVEVVVTKKVDKDNYEVMYKNHEHTLSKIVLNKQFLLSPTSYNVVSPVSLLVD